MPDALSRLTTALADRYRLERELGQGGMATVYLAQDLKHNRQVAVKVLREEVAESVGRPRFLREIQLAAKLSHPHILPLFDSGEAGGLLYYVMPNVAGHSLRDRLAAERQFPVDEAVRITTELAGALDHAHRAGVVHRDIKPENIMLQDGHALVADFGIGKALSEVEDEADTQIGANIGTPAYMSPEQAAGEPVDGRSDLYSLGCVLYEMLVGEPPFTGPTVQAVIAKRFVQTPVDVTALREGVSRPVARAMQKVLARTPIDRYETGAQFVAALAASDASSAVFAAPEKSIAVLPFTSLSPDPDDAFFADGVTEEILNALAQIPGLVVSGRSSVFSFKGRNEDPRSVGTKLNVATILEGTMRRSGNRLRVTVQLISTADGYQLWAERYDRVLEDVFAVQDEIASAIASRLKVSLAAGRVGAETRPPTQHLGAYELYLKGRALLYRRGRSILKALESFNAAVALDPGYAQAWAGLADGYTTSGYSGLARPEQVMPQALAAAQRALAIDPDLAEAHNALACATLLYERNYSLAEREFRRAIELNPNYTQALAWYGLFFLHWAAGRQREASQHIARLLELDPLSGYAQFILGFSLFTSGRLEEAVRHARRGLELDPDSYLGEWCLMGALLLSGEYEQAVASAERGLAMSGRHAWALCLLPAIYAAWGKLDEARAVYREAEARSAREYMQPALLSIAAAAVGEMDQAMALARRAVDERDPFFVLGARTFPFYDRHRGDPRFHEIVAMLGFPAAPREEAD